MLLKDLRENYKVCSLSLKDKDKSSYVNIDHLVNKTIYHLHSKDSTSGNRMPHKYLCSLEKITKNKFFILNTNIKVTKKNVIDKVNEYIKSLPYDCEYYHPMYRKGLFEEFFVYDYLEGLGFKKNMNDLWIYKSNIYFAQTIKLFINFTENEFKISYISSELSWVENKSKRNCEDIKKCIDSILSPLLISESIENIQLHNKLNSNIDLGNLKLNQIVNNELLDRSLKEELKEKLQSILNTL